jgi:hypothetical protein
MVRSLIWIEDDENGWACSHCRWVFPVPTLLRGEEAKAAYDRLAAGKFREHNCEVETSLPAAKQPDADTAFAERARMLIKRGYKPKVAVDLVLHEIEFAHGNDTKLIGRARADAEDFLLRVRKGLI